MRKLVLGTSVSEILLAGWGRDLKMPSPPLQDVHPGKVETGRVEAPKPGSCFHFHPFWDDVGTQAVPDLQCHYRGPFLSLTPQLHKV